MRETNRNSLKPPKLKAIIVEPILKCCIMEASFSEVLLEIQSILPLPDKMLKRYLFHLINHELVFYNGQRQAYLTMEEGLELLRMIIKEKKTKKITSEDIIITLESSYC